MTFTNQQQNLTEFILHVFHSKDVFNILRHLILRVVCYAPMTAIPKELPVDRRVEETQCAKWSAAMTVGFYRPPAPCTVRRFVLLRKGHLIARIGEDAKWGVINRQTSYQIKNLYPRNILYNPLHHWTFLDIRMSEFF